MQTHQQVAKYESIQFNGQTNRRLNNHGQLTSIVNRQIDRTQKWHKSFCGWSSASTCWCWCCCCCCCSCCCSCCLCGGSGGFVPAMKLRHTTDRFEPVLNLMNHHDWFLMSPIKIIKCPSFPPLSTDSKKLGKKNRGACLLAVLWKRKTLSLHKKTHKNQRPTFGLVFLLCQLCQQGALIFLKFNSPNKFHFHNWDFAISKK